jgi:cell division GTPase FtsZ
MKVLLIGIGQAGGKITDQFIGDDRKSHVPHTMEGIVINTATSDLMGIRNVSKENRLLLGETTVKGHGVGADNRRAAEIAEDESEVILNRVSRFDTSNIDAFFVLAGLGGGTGSGAMPVICRHLKKIYDEPVYGIGILPAETEGDIYTLNAARSLKALLPNVDSTILVDNGAFLRSGESVREAYERINTEIVKRIGILCRSGEARSKKDVGEMVVDASEVINTLKGGGISSIGYASEIASRPSFLTTLFRKKQYQIGKASRIISVTKRAVKGRLLLPCEYRTARRALIVIAGPPDQMDRKGIEKAREWLENNIAGHEVRGGDYPLPRSRYVGCVVLLSGISNAPRVRAMLERAKMVQQKAGEVPTGEHDLDFLLSDIESLHF